MAPPPGYLRVHVSLFYRLPEWNRLLKDLLEPALLAPEAVGDIQNVVLSLNFERGQNLRASFDLPKPTAEKTLQELDARFRQFLHAYPSPTPTPAQAGKALFLDFPNNSIQYNLFREEEQPLGPEWQSLLSQESSGHLPVRPNGAARADSIFRTILLPYQVAVTRLLVTYLKDGACDEDTIFTLFLYGLMKVLHALEREMGFTRQFLHQIPFPQSLAAPPAPATESLHQQYLAIEPYLLRIYDATWQPISLKQEGTALEGMAAAIDLALQGMVGLVKKPKERLPAEGSLLLGLLTYQFGISQRAEEMALYFVRRVLGQKLR